MVDEPAGIPDPELQALEQMASELEGIREERESIAEQQVTDSERLKRLQKDFANFRRRIERDRAEWEVKGVERAVLTLLPALDHIEIALAHATEENTDPRFREGLAMIRDQFTKSLADLGVERLAVVGTVFDPHLAEAVAVIGTPDTPPGTVLNELQPGFRFRDTIIRPARVAVAGPSSQG